MYDGGGRQRSAGLELWLPGEEYPRRGSGLVIAGSSFELEAIQVSEKDAALPYLRDAATPFRFGAS